MSGGPAGDDLLEGAGWECGFTPAGRVDGPAGLGSAQVDWVRARVPGTAALAFEAAGRDLPGDLDAWDWWFRARIEHRGPPVRCRLCVEGVATISDTWLNGDHLVRTESMFRRAEVPVEVRTGVNDVVIRVEALAPHLAVRRPRPRWKTALVDNQNLRWVRTSLLGRLRGWAEVPVPVGPWRPVRLLPDTGKWRVVERNVTATSVGTDQGLVEVDVVIAGGTGPATTARLMVASAGGEGPGGPWEGVLSCEEDGEGIRVSGRLRIAPVRCWWPHTHGSQPLYGLGVDLGSERVELGRVGFRTLTVDRADDGFRVSVNGTEVFWRGAVWFPVDPVGLSAGKGAVRGAVQVLRDANLNMVRVPGTAVYEDGAFWDACDELGVMVWQDCMLAFMDLPEDDLFSGEVQGELAEVFAELGGRPCLAVVCGSQETEEQAAMLSRPRETWTSPLLDKTVADLVGRALPGTVYVRSNPTGGELPFRMDAGVSQYFGVGGYLRRPDQVRQDGVRFAVECLAFSNPPEPDTVDEACGGAVAAGHAPSWKRAVHHDAGRSWDLEDMTEHYTGELFEVDPFLQRYRDPERALELRRATVAALTEQVMSEWRRPGSACGGAIVLAGRDLRPGAGWGLVDALGRPKSAWFALKRVLSPLAVLLTDEGLNGLRIHLVNDGPEIFAGHLRLELFTRGELLVEAHDSMVRVPERGALSIDAARLMETFVDITYAYRFRPAAHDVVVATLLGEDGGSVSQAVYLPLGPARPLEGDVGLAAEMERGVGTCWDVAVSTRRFAQRVTVRAPGFVASDSWFDLPPGTTRRVTLEPLGERERPRGEVRALNARAAARLEVAGDGGPPA